MNTRLKKGYRGHFFVLGAIIAHAKSSTNGPESKPRKPQLTVAEQASIEKGNS
jgi:hypothetical protein